MTACANFLPRLRVRHCGRQAFTPVDPVWLPRVYADRRAAWEGVYPLAPETSIRIEAAAYRNRPVAFHIIEPWTRPVGATAPERSFWARTRDGVGMVVFVVVLVGAGLFALRNIRLGRGDRDARPGVDISG